MALLKRGYDLEKEAIANPNNNSYYRNFSKKCLKNSFKPLLCNSLTSK
ncbi:MAG: hypothetical protein F6K24_47625 [Okeania sp. SIO2D1]|nr:hypothetical protein [Okeania sp. SIO2D1]